MKRQYCNDNSGIYCLKEKITGKIYVGQTTCFRKRYSSLKSDFNNNRVSNWQLRGKRWDDFEFIILEECSKEHLLIFEKKWMNLLESLDNNKGFNLRCDDADGMITHQSTSEKISSRLKTEWENGTRDGHSAKLKKAWSSRERLTQSNIMRNNLTKFQYKITDPHGQIIIADYRELKRLNLTSILSTYHRHGSTVGVLKGFKIERVVI